jgi:endonuclease/exonuclease/phosphatase family metal-dependent hydrolase
MKGIICRKAFVFLSFISCIGIQEASSQESIKVMCYNVLNYPNVDYDDFRADTLKKITDHFMPDLLLIQELKHPRGLDSILTKAFNQGPVGPYTSGTWQWQVSAPWSSWKLQQNVIYNTDKLTLIDEGYIQTGVRDHNYFKFLVKDPLLALHQDSTFFYAFSIHLKSSQGADNVAARLQMAQILTNFLEGLEPNSTIILAGDFNIYTSSEPAYQQLISGNNTSVLLIDPLQSPGAWNNNAGYSDVHTQSTRTSQLNGDGAGGGLDDRFDFVLLSENMMLPNSRVSYLSNSYQSLGNNGNCFNQSILNCQAAGVPQNVRQALFQMSDHLPVILELNVDLPLTVHTDNTLLGAPYFIGANVVNERLILEIPRSEKSGHLYTVSSMQGSQLLTGRTTSSQQLNIDVSYLSAGWYLLHVPGLNTKPFKFLKL